MAQHAHGTGHEAHHHHAKKTGVMRWITTTDHKEIGIMYLWTAFFFFILGGILALMMRAELASPGRTVMSAQAYNEFFGMHATVMIFLWVMPAMAGMGNYFVPIMIKAPDMAFPRINALSFWLIPPAGIMLFAGWIFPNMRFMDVAWVGYPPLSVFPGGGAGGAEYNLGLDLWIMSLVTLGTASTLGAINFLVTIMRMRAPDVSFHNMPLFVWAQFTTAILLLFATPVLTIALVLLLLDRKFGTSFYVNQAGDPILWQHLFWFFGHPEVYILILPAMGVVSEVLPKFAGRPIFGYRAIAYSTVAIGFLGFIVWAHHMFTTGIDPRVRAVFMLNTMVIGVPTGVKIFNWITTMWGGQIRFTPPMLFSIGFVSMFVIGGIDGVFMASIPIDYSLHDSYWAVAHIHYVLFAGSVMGIFAGVYYWFPRMSGRMYNQTLAKWHFWTTLVAMNITFMVMHWLGTEQMPRRVYDYADKVVPIGPFEWSIGGMNMFATVGAFMLAASTLLFFINILWALRAGERVNGDPWGGMDRVEWQIWPEKGHVYHGPVAAATGHESAAAPAAGQGTTEASR